MTRIVLASTSPFRQKILSNAGISFEAVAPLCDEKSIFGLPPKILAARRSALKAEDVARRVPPGARIIGADQVLGLGEKSYDKASSEEEAVTRLRFFAGKTHVLYSGICVMEVARSGVLKTVFETVVELPMTMRALTDAEIASYVQTGEWQGSVGCYRIEGQGRALFRSVPDDDDAIIGLPLQVLRPFLVG